MRTARRCVALVVIACFVAASLPAQAGGALLQGRVVAPDGLTPRSGVTVALVDESGEKVYRSGPTGERGAFRVEGAPAGTYGVVVETPQGAFLAGSPLRLGEGTNPALALKLQPGERTAAEGSTTDPGMKKWTKWVIAGGIVVAGALAFAGLDNDEDDASAF